MAEEQVKDLFGDSDEEEPQQEAAEGGEEGPSEQPDARQTAADLFGSSDEEDEQPGPSHRVTTALGEDEDEPYERSPSPGPARGPPVLVEVEPLDVLPPESLRLVKLPNILGVDPRPFDPDTFDAGAEVEIDARGFKRVRLRDQNCIRWRWSVDEEGSQVRESNARFVRWSDGSLQLMVGDEVLDVREIDTTNEHSYMYARLPGLIQCQGQLTRKMVFQPASLQSNLHKQLRAAAEKLHVKTQKVRATTTLVDPKKLKAEAEKAEADRIRARERMAEKQGKTMRKFSMPRAPRLPQQLNADYLEEDEDLDEEGLAEDMQEAQRQRMLGGRGRAAYDEAEEEARAARLAAAKSGAPPSLGKRRRVEEEEDEEEISGEDLEQEEEEEDEEEEEGAEEMKDFIVDEDEEEGGRAAGNAQGAAEEEAPAAGRRQQQQQQQPAVKQRRQVVLSDSEDE